MKRIALSIDGREVEVESGATLLEACRETGVDLPSLCALEAVSLNASCGVCVVEVEGARSLVRACVTPASPGMKVLTGSARVMRARRVAVELLLANHPSECLSCLRSGDCELRKLADRLGIRERRFPRTRKEGTVDESAEGLVRDHDKCVLCGRCVTVCGEVQGVSAIAFSGRGSRTRVAPYMDLGLGKSVCVQCGQCTTVCPTGALVERDESREVWRHLADPGKTVLVQTAPAIRASLGEALGMEAGSLVTGKMVAALRRLGFDRVFDTQFAADLTILEEGTELLTRVREGGTLPMITSCSPGWINYIETFRPALLPHLSTCKSPQQMFGAIAKSMYAERAGIDPATMSVVSIMPCTAKKRETGRPGMDAAWRWWRERNAAAVAAYRDVDFALTTRELARMIREAGIDMARLPDEDFDDPLGRSTGAATIFGTTGGVMEAALRTVYELVNGKPLEGIDFLPVRGLEGIKEASVELGGKSVRVAVAHGLANARKILDGIERGGSPYAFIEVMSCPGGCIGGGGQPLRGRLDRRLARNAALYVEDRRLAFRKSHENEAVKSLYADFLGEPLGHLSHQLLHTEYRARQV
jgi:iron-only hydrogenase group A